MKKKVILFTLVLALFVSMVSVPEASAAGETLPSYDYMILGDAVYKSTSTTTLAQELASTKKGKAVKETFSDKDEVRMTNSWVKFHHKTDSKSGFSASAYHNVSRNEVVIAFAGTNEQTDWVDKGSDDNRKRYGAILGNKAHKQKPLAEAYVRDVSKLLGKTYTHPKTKKKVTVKATAKIVMAGHSLGGYLVQVAGLYAISNKDYAKNFKAGYTFNPLGISSVDITSTQWTNNKKGKYPYFVHLQINPDLAAIHNLATGRVLIGDSSTRFVKGLGGYWGNLGPYVGHLYKSLYRHYAW